MPFEQGGRRGAGGPPVHVPRIILDARAKTHFLHHFEVVFRARADDVVERVHAKLLGLAQVPAQLPVLQSAPQRPHRIDAGEAEAQEHRVVILAQLAQRHVASQRLSGPGLDAAERQDEVTGLQLRNLRQHHRQHGI